MACSIDESLRQPTRGWFDTTPREASRPLLSGVEAGALPGAIDRFLADGDDDGEEEEEALVSKDGVKAYLGGVGGELSLDEEGQLSSFGVSLSVVKLNVRLSEKALAAGQDEEAPTRTCW